MEKKNRLVNHLWGGILALQFTLEYVFLVKNIYLPFKLQSAFGLLLFAVISMLEYRRFFKVILLAVGMSGCFLMVSLLRGNFDIPKTALILSTFGTGMLIASRRVAPWAYVFPLAGALAFFTYQFAIGTDPNLIFYDVDLDLRRTSRNGVSSYLLVAFSVFIFGFRNRYPTVNLLLAVWIFLLAVYAVGRSGILFSLILLAGCFVLSWGGGKDVWRLVKGGAAVAFMVAFSVYLFLQRDVFFSRFAEASVHGDLRFYLWFNYIKSGGFGGLILGNNITESNIFTLSTYNLHNSFLMLHSVVGMFAFVVFLSIAWVIYKFCRVEKIYALILLIILGRASTDSIFFIMFIDSTIYAYLAYGFSTTLIKENRLLSRKIARVNTLQSSRDPMKYKRLNS